MRGRESPGNSPDFTIASLWQMPHASTLMRTCPGAGSGTSRSTSSNGPPAFATCTAFIKRLALQAYSRFHFLNLARQPQRGYPPVIGGKNAISPAPLMAVSGPACF